MVDALPFRGLRFDPEICGAWGGLLGPPYDVLTPERAAVLRALSRYQITHVETPGADGADSAAATLRDWRETGALKRDAEPSYYVARHRFRQGDETRERTSLLAAVRLAPWSEAHAGGGSTKPHEWTMAGPREERTTLRATVRADVSPLMVVAPDASGALGAALEGAAAGRPAAEGIDPAGEEHALFVVVGEREVDAIRAALARETLYMADGHHRYESALGHREVRRRRAGITWAGDEPENFVLMGIVRAEDPGLIVGATHRLLHAPPPADALERLRATFEVETLGPGGDAGALMARVAAAPADRAPIGVHGLTDDDLLLLADDRTRAALPPELPASWAALGPAVLQFGALAPAFGVDEAALLAGRAVSYEHDAEAACGAVATGAAQAAFLLQAPSLGQIFEAADAGDRMPQKSTYFVPKLPTGLVLHAFDAGDDELF